MKKNIVTFLLIGFFSIFPIIAYASGGITVSTRNISVYKGKSTTFSIVANNAAGRVDISSSNPSVAKVNKSSEWIENNSIKVEVTGVSVGTATITVTLADAATFDEEVLNGSYTITINVKEVEKNNNTNNNKNTKTEIRSDNNNIKNLSVKGYEIVKKNSEYELTVNNNISSIEILGSPEDEKASITGIGEKKLEIGLNKFEVIVISESGLQNKIMINVYRKEGFFIEDIDSLLLDDTISTNSILINSDSIINEEILNKIKNSKRTLSFDMYNTEKKLLYSWIIDGNKIEKSTEFNTNINFGSEYAEEVGKISNYSEGKFIHFEHDGDLPSGTIIKLYVGDKFSNDNLINIYNYDLKNKKMDLVKSELPVKEGYIEFEIDHCTDYFLTRSTINKIVSKNDSFITYKNIALIELIVIIALATICIFKSKRKSIL